MMTQFSAETVYPEVVISMLAPAFESVIAGPLLT